MEGTERTGKEKELEGKLIGAEQKISELQEIVASMKEEKEELIEILKSARKMISDKIEDAESD